MAEADDEAPAEVRRGGPRHARVCTHDSHKDGQPRNFGDPDWMCPEHPRSTVDQPDRPYMGKPIER